MNEREIIELIYFLEHEFISREEHDVVHELLFNLNAKLDEAYGRWELKDLLKKVRGV